MRLLPISLFLSLLLSTVLSLFAQDRAITKEEYLTYMKSAAEDAWSTLDADRDRWRKSIDLEYVFGYNPPGNEPYLAALMANLYTETRDPEYLRRAKKLLLEFGSHRNAYPKDFVDTRPEYGGVLPVLPNIFYFGKFCHAYAVVKKHATLTPAERASIEDGIAGSADYVVRFQEWGPMNRALLRAEGLLYAAKLLPDHPHQPRWLTMGNAIVGDNFEEWEIEDATGYNAVWLHSLMAYLSDIREDERAYRSPFMQYYFEYYLQMISPAGIIPDVGDAPWGGGWERFMVFFEKAAAVNKDPRLRWAAAQQFRKYLEPTPEKKNVWLALVCSDALRWADFSLPAAMPTNGSRQVLDDIVGKKIVFRNGWAPTSTYMLLNYRDEGDGGWLFRENLRTSLSVEEEKMHHGHSDQNSIALLMRNKSILLHDGGYRDYMPSGPYGAFRADYYHNQLAVRDGKIALGQRQGEFRYATPGQHAVPGQTMLEFFRNSGASRDVRTRKIDFLSLKDVEYSRTRLIDDGMGYEADRLVFYIKKLDWFVVVDALRFTRPTYLTMANLWHTRQILSTGPGWYDTAYDSLQTLDVRGPERLLIYFPQRDQLVTGVEEQQRYWQREKVMYQMIGRHGYRNAMQQFVTVLIPHGAEQNPADLAACVEMIPTENPARAFAMKITRDGNTYVIGAKLDMEAELIRDWRRPMYTYESGKTRYGDFETDAYTLFAVETPSSVRYAVVGAVRVDYRGKILHEQLPVRVFLNFDGSPDQPGTFKMRFWEGEAPR
ncbi:MAG: hypothetical protein IT282_03300 [Bacteroidetes bacterium]|nr:hypothetical protein [Bacteroidota bacterium]